MHLKRKWPDKLRLDENETLVSYISRLFACLDCNLFFAKNEVSPKQIISANDWIDMDSFEFLKRVCVYGRSLNECVKNIEKYLKYLSKRVRLIKGNDGEILGRGTLDANFNGLISVGGIKGGSTSLFMGVLRGKCDVANRFSARPIVSEDLLKPWLEEQARLLSNDLSWQEYDSQLEIGSLLYSFGIPTGPLTVAYYQNKSLNRAEVKKTIEKTKDNKYVVLYDFFRHLFEERKRSYTKNVFFTNCGSKPISICESHNGEVYFIDSEFPSRNWQKELSSIIADVCAEVWHENVKDIETCSTDKNPIYEIVGTYADGEMVTRHCHSVIERKSVKAKEDSAKNSSKKRYSKKKPKK